MKVFQYIDILHENDGIGNDIQGISEQLNELNVENFIGTRINLSSKKVLNLNQVSTHPTDINILHYGGYGFPLEFFLQQKGKKVLRFHNITPVSFFLPYLSKEMAATFEWNQKRAELELYSLVQYCDFIWCDSLFNLKTLETFVQVPKEKAYVLPIQKDFQLKPKTFKNPKSLVFIGRWVPNKKLEDLLFVLYFLVKLDSQYTLSLLGKSSSIFEAYNQKIFHLIQSLNLQNHVFLYENVPEETKLQILDRSEVFLCMSEHEGFCIPVLEAMSHNVLVFAYSQEAVLETCRKSGIFFKEKDFPKIAHFIHFILQNENYITRILESQEKTLEHYKNSKLRTIFSDL